MNDLYPLDAEVGPIADPLVLAIERRSGPIRRREGGQLIGGGWRTGVACEIVLGHYRVKGIRMSIRECVLQLLLIVIPVLVLSLINYTKSR
jgi:hypothetical protein